ncbi:hypothetical protein E2C01_073814 [Portunus trituberculatus]|uniref:Uncharacterized protein n=1 Tax=Portunus trituberculatus TaxID=210409 RepID=A0A5B7IBK6_PORTR|nr:hypothetical protein [Portunus trituberculatus]
MINGDRRGGVLRKKGQEAKSSSLRRTVIKETKIKRDREERVQSHIKGDKTRSSLSAPPGRRIRAAEGKKASGGDVALSSEAPTAHAASHRTPDTLPPASPPPRYTLPRRVVCGPNHRTVPQAKHGHATPAAATPPPTRRHHRHIPSMRKGRSLLIAIK